MASPVSASVAALDLIDPRDKISPGLVPGVFVWSIWFIVVEWKTVVVASMPALFGGGFPLLVEFLHRLHRTSYASPRVAIGVEMIYLIVWFGVTVAVAIAGFRMLRSRNIAGFVLGIIGIALGFRLIGMGIDNGAALVYAT